MMRVAAWFAWGLIGFIRILPVAAVAHFGRFTSAFVMLFLRRHRALALKQMKDCLSDELSDDEIRKLALEHFKRLGENFACSVRTAFIPEEKLSRYVEVVGLEKLVRSDACRNRILAIGHLGNFELLARLTSSLKDYVALATYRSLKQAEFDRILAKIRGRSKCLFFERRNGADQLRERLRQGGCVLGLFVDQNAGRGGIAAPFFGRECSSSPAPALFALRYRAELHILTCHRIRIAKWRIEVSDPVPLRNPNGRKRTVREITAEVNRHFEGQIRRDPANWFWVHRRWKKLPPAPVHSAEGNAGLFERA